MYGGISSVSGLNTGQREAIYDRATRFGAGFATANLGGQAGRLAKAGVDASDAASMAFNIERVAGATAAEAITQDDVLEAAQALKNSGAVRTIDEGIGLAATMSKNGRLSGKELIGIATAVGSRERAPQVRTAADLAKARFLGNRDPKARLNSLLGDSDASRAMLGEKVATQLGTVNWSQRGADVAAIEGPAENELMKTAEGRTALSTWRSAADQAAAAERLAGTPRDYESFVQKNLSRFGRVFGSFVPGRVKTARQAAGEVGGSLTAEQFEELYLGAGRNEIGGDDYAEVLRRSRAARPEEFQGWSDRPDYAELNTHFLESIDASLKRLSVAPHPVVPGGQTEGR
jgi:hypothetical protein